MKEVQLITPYHRFICFNSQCNSHCVIKLTRRIIKISSWVHIAQLGFQDMVQAAVNKYSHCRSNSPYNPNHMNISSIGKHCGDI
jgi:hypothetical protein